MDEQVINAVVKNAVRDALTKNAAVRNSQLPTRVSKLIVAAAAALKRGESADFYFGQMSAQDRKDMDEWIVQTQHPLGYKPGTERDRFFALVKEQR